MDKVVGRKSGLRARFLDNPQPGTCGHVCKLKRSVDEKVRYYGRKGYLSKRKPSG